MTESENINKRYWSIDEVSTLLCEPKSKIRFWGKYFGLELLRGINQKRKFTQQDIDKLAAIKSYVAEGYKLRAIKNKI
jgi:DNA-binding transcriptional MerR regulator